MTAPFKNNNTYVVTNYIGRPVYNYCLFPNRDIEMSLAYTLFVSKQLSITLKEITVFYNNYHSTAGREESSLYHVGLGLGVQKHEYTIPVCARHFRSLIKVQKKLITGLG